MPRKHSRNLSQRAATRRRNREAYYSVQNSLRDKAEGKLTVGVIKLRLAATLPEIRKACNQNNIDLEVTSEKQFSQEEYALIKAYILGARQEDLD